MVSLGNRTIEESISAVKCPYKLVESAGVLPKQEGLIVGVDEPLGSLESLLKPPFVNGEGQAKAFHTGGPKCLSLSHQDLLIL